MMHTQPELGRQLLYLSQPDVASLAIPMAELILALHDVFIDKVEGRTQMPPKIGVYPKDDSWFYAQLSHVSRLGSVCVKWQAGVVRNYERGLPYLTGLLILNDADTGIPLAVMDSTWITAKRTGAASGLSARVLARSGSEVMSLLGCGVQARTHLEALLLVCPDLRSVVCYDIRPEKAEEFVEEVRSSYPGLGFTIVNSPEEATRAGDIVVTAGPITMRPHRSIQPGWLKRGALALPIDFDCYWQPSALHETDKFYVDHLEQFQHLRDEGVHFKDTPTVVGELGQLLSGQLQGRESPEERIIIMNLGVSIEDIATAVLVYERALDEGVGHILPLYEF